MEVNLSPRRRLLSSQDLRNGGDTLAAVVRAFNLRLTRRMSSCRLLHVVQEEGSEGNLLRGGVKINFRLKEPVRVRNEICVEGASTEEFVTSFRFSSKSAMVVPATNQDTTRDILERLRHHFNILQSCSLHLYERELSASQQETFYRPLLDDEIPLELTLLWTANQERKSVVLTDHDPSQTLYLGCSLKQLETKLRKLASEEEKAVEETRLQYTMLRQRMREALGEETSDDI